MKHNVMKRPFINLSKYSKIDPLSLINHGKTIQIQKQKIFHIKQTLSEITIVFN